MLQHPTLFFAACLLVVQVQPHFKCTQWNYGKMQRANYKGAQG